MQQRLDLDRRHRRVGRRVDRSVHRDQVVRADELVEFDVVHVAVLAALRRVQHQEQVAGVHVHLRHLVARDAVLDRQRVEAEDLGQHLLGLVVPGGDVHPDQPVVPGQQRRQLVDGVIADDGRPAAGVRAGRHGGRGRCNRPLRGLTGADLIGCGPRRAGAYCSGALAQPHRHGLMVDNRWGQDESDAHADLRFAVTGRLTDQPSAGIDSNPCRRQVPDGTSGGTAGRRPCRDPSGPPRLATTAARLPRSGRHRHWPPSCYTYPCTYTHRGG